MEEQHTIVLPENFELPHESENRVRRHWMPERLRSPVRLAPRLLLVPRPKKLPTLKKMPPTWGLKLENQHPNGEAEIAVISCQAFTKGEARAAFKKVLKELVDQLGPNIGLPDGLSVFRLPDPEPKPFDRHDITTYPPKLLDEAQELSRLAQNLQPAGFVHGATG